VTPLIDGRP